ncbi:enoyl-CoA hydratase/isomerase family protein [Sporichthya sp.]|uniref:enoyl-CoA hydratase/isomerase family protein n=1 Tax=Sporichthya sp. TaxID=65475 RepID=UPI0017E9E071|nr:enoyl-CoA hydratase/isomerase family protein [Sporichthya sp.]MBA3741388.1 enoyl-CoA hydratase/isomerase family protein [Sporichthya sp.]
MVSDEPYVLTTVDGPIGWLTLNDPERLNPVTRARVAELNVAARALSDRDDVHVVVIQGAGRAFCAGADVSQGQPAADRRVPLGGGALLPGAPADWTLAGMRQPVIAMIRGAAVGFGLELALQADIRIASEDAKFVAPFAKLGIISDTGTGTWLLPRLIGWSKAAELYYTGRKVLAPEALELGLVNDVRPEADLLDFTRALAEQIAENSPWSLRIMKRLIFDGLQHSRGEHLLLQNQRFNERPARPSEEGAP